MTQNKPDCIATVIADSNFVIPVYILVLSLKYFQPAQRIHILGISLSDEEKALFTQFNNVFVFDSSIPRSDTPGAMRIIADILKGEALRTAEGCEENWVALLDGDCIATGDITPYLQPDEPALYARSRSAAEDARIFQYYRASGETGIPSSFLQRWKDDVAQRDTPARKTTVLSGNLVLHRDYLHFAAVWQEFMDKVLNHAEPSKTGAAYYMPAEFALSAWLMFADNPPPLREVLLNSNPDAYLAHLGPAPKYWKLWTRRNIQYFDQVIRLLDWAKKEGYAIPALPYALKKPNKSAVIIAAWAYDIIYRTRRTLKKAYRRVAGNAPEQQARKYGKQKI